MLIRSIFSKNNRSIVLSIISITYLLLMFIIWNVNVTELMNVNLKIFMNTTYILGLALLLNIDRIIKENRIKTVLIYVLLMVLLTINSFHIERKTQAIRYIFTVLPIFIVYQLSFELESKRIIKYGFKILLGLFFFYNFVGMIGVLFKLDYFFFGIPNKLVDNYRYSSILNNPNAWGEYALISLFISTYFLLKNKDLMKRLIYIVAIIFSVFALIASMSRSAVLMGIILYIGLLLFSKFLDKFMRRLLYIGLAIGIIGIISLYLYDKEFMLSLFRLTQGLTDRDIIWSYLTKQIKENFWYGVGYGNANIILTNPNLISVTSAHNLYLGLMYEMGFIPFLFLMIYIIKKTVVSFLSLRYTNKLKIELLWIGLFLVSFLVGQIFEYSFFMIGSMNTFVFLIFGLLIEQIRLIKEEGIYKKKITHMITGLDNGGSESMLYKILKYGDKSRFTLKVISLDTKGFYGERIEKLGIKVVDLNLKKVNRLPLSIIKLFYHVMSTDVLQTWLYHANLIGVIVGRLMFVDKIIWGVRQADVSVDHNKKTTAKIAAMSKYLSSCTNYILSCSDEVSNAHIELGYNKRRFVTIYNGFELSLFKGDPSKKEEVKKELGIKEELVFINVARYDIQKDHETMFKALKRFKDSYKQSFKLIMCGIGIEETNRELMQKLANANLTKEAILLGVRSDVERLMSAADYFLLSSLGEGFPNVLGEAMASNLIPIVTDVGDCKMIVGNTGAVVQKQDFEAFYNEILNIINLEEDVKKKMRSDARLRIENTFDIVEITKEYEALY